MTEKEIKKALNKIGWDIKGRYPNKYIFSHKNENTRLRVMSDRIEKDIENVTPVTQEEIENNDEYKRWKRINQ